MRVPATSGIYLSLHIQSYFFKNVLSSWVCVHAQRNTIFTSKRRPEKLFSLTSRPFLLSWRENLFFITSGLFCSNGYQTFLIRALRLQKLPGEKCCVFCKVGQTWFRLPSLLKREPLHVKYASALHAGASPNILTDERSPLVKKGLKITDSVIAIIAKVPTVEWDHG